jgi:uncharacterized protein (DUF2147 family)
MKHRTLAPALGLFAAALFNISTASQASAADPSGIWAKDDGSAKMEVKKCGRSICSKIVWLREPNDSRGQPLRDARNEDTSMRNRPIIGLSLFRNMTATEANTWVGNVYNPEEGKIYTDVKVTLASRRQIVLRGCKAWVLCREKVWIKSTLSAPTKPAEPTEVNAPGEPSIPADKPAPSDKPIEVNAPAAPVAPAEPEENAPKPAPKAEVPIVEAAREPETQPEPKSFAAAPSALGTPVAPEARVSVAPPKILRPASPAPSQQNFDGFRIVTTANSPELLPLTGDNVASMMVMTMPSPVAAKPEP